MKNIFKAATSMPSTPAMRNNITGFILQCLQPYSDEKGIAFKGLHLYIVCENPEEEAAARVALYMDKPELFVSLLERKLKDHFIQPEAGWFFEPKLVGEVQLPASCMRKNNFALEIIGPDQKNNINGTKAFIQVLAGQTEQADYTLDPDKQLKFYIGRTKTPQLSSGKIQQNDIVFTGIDDPGFSEDKEGANAKVSRNHAYIVYDQKTNSWLLYPDKGGLPENGNKLKVHTANDTIKWLNIYGVSHELNDGDQVELGGAAILKFSIVQAVSLVKIAPPVQADIDPHARYYPH